MEKLQTHESRLIGRLDDIKPSTSIGLSINFGEKLHASPKAM